MAGVLVTFTTPEISLTGAALKTCILVRNAANHRFKIKGFGAYFDGTSATNEPVQCFGYFATSNGTFTALTGIKVDQSLPEVVQTQGGHTATAEPAGTANVYKRFEVHPQSSYEWAAPFGDEIPCGAAAADGARFAIQALAANAVNIVCWISIEE